MGEIGELAQTLLRGVRFDEVFRAATWRKRRALGSRRPAARYGLRKVPKSGTQLDGRTSLRRSEMAERERLERGSLPRNFVPRRLFRRRSGIESRENLARGRRTQRVRRRRRAR